jgi:hypothetical protein
VDTLFSEHEKLHKSVLRIHMNGAGDVAVLTDILNAVNVLHNRLYVLKRFKEKVNRGQLRHPSKHVAAADRLTVRDVVIGDPGRVEFYGFPQVAPLIAEIITELINRPHIGNLEQVLIPICGHEIEILRKHKYTEEEIASFFKINTLRPALHYIRGADVGHEEAYYGSGKADF